MKQANWLFDPEVTKLQLRGQLAWFLVWLAVTVIGAFILKPASDLHGTHTQLGLPACYSVVMFDRPCPGCGLTTSWTSVLHGDFSHAFHAHTLGPIMYGLYSLSALAALYGVVRKLRLRTDTKIATVTLASAIVIFLAYGAIRFANTTYNDPRHKIWMTAQGR
ncbi:MAG: DUF2752 domain-containing protein [Fimbriimonadaceae bacterium]|nr:MAG: DUF2752 domain-containing protein [Fimbriimonadaceae bacterium]